MMSTTDGKRFCLLLTSYFSHGISNAKKKKLGTNLWPDPSNLACLGRPTSK